MPTARDMTAEDMAAYRAGARERAEREREALLLREKRAWDLAREAAALLRDRFQASRVVVFGSLVHAGSFTQWSDVDIAAWGLRPEDTLRALGAVMDLSAEIQLSLLDISTCRASLLEVIEREGVAL